MTKIKNTKKGMAKKTLSMSLVVAMLATSNVPVWAAEFSDGSDWHQQGRRHQLQ